MPDDRDQGSARDRPRWRARTGVVVIIIGGGRCRGAGGGDVRASGIDVSVIAPPAYLNDFVAQEPARVHHVAAQRVLSDPGYRAFYRREAQRGAEIVVDNGVFDLGHSLSAPQLVDAAHAVAAREVILPDVLHDGPATIAASDEAARIIGDLCDDLRLCVVLHAADDAQWLRTYDEIIARGYVGAVALPASRRPAPETELCRTRWAATRHLDEHGLIVDGLVYRLLGLGRTGHLELVEQRRYEWITSVDGAAPVILGAMGIAMVPGGPYRKPSTPRIDELGPIRADRFELIRRNIAVLRAAAGSPVRIPECPR